MHVWPGRNLRLKIDDVVREIVNLGWKPRILQNDRFVITRHSDKDPFGRYTGSPGYSKSFCRDCAADLQQLLRDHFFSANINLYVLCICAFVTF